MIKHVFSIFLLLLIQFSTFAQSFRQYSWEDSGIRYNALMITYSDDNNIVRVNFKYNNILHIVEYNAMRKVYPKYAANDLVFEGSTPKIIYSAQKVSNLNYTPEHLVLTNFNSSTNKGSEFLIIPKADIGKSGIRNTAPKVTSRNYNNGKDLTTNIDIKSYILTNEPLYAKLTNQSGGSNNPIVAKNQTLHLILTGDIQDKSIGTAVRNDLSSMKDLFSNISSHHPKLKLNLIEVTGSQLTKENITKQISNLKIGENDIVFFYYSGHGSNPLPKRSDFPTMALKGSGYQLEAVYDNIRSYRPRLTLVVGDLCNSVPRVKSDNNQEIMVSSIPYRYDKTKIATLFLNAQGSMISTSSSYDEYSYCVNGAGAFTTGFLKSLRSTVNTGSHMSTDWQSIFKSSYTDAYNQTKRITNKKGTKGQNGFYRGNITY